jgi:hypothetical protein
MDEDGLLDVVTTFRDGVTTISGRLAVYDPRTGALLSQIITNIPTNVSTGAGYGPATPFIGDIVGNGKPAIAFVGLNVMRAYKYDASQPVNNRLSQFWSYPVTDGSSSTGLTIFDFNQDGISEIVYRDETNLRIINGSLKDHLTGLPVSAPYNLFTTTGVSNTTLNEYPVVADINHDDQAEIITSGRLTGAGNWAGQLQVFSTNDPVNSQWAPARKVWNQYSYNVVNINEDLTVPQYQLNPATVFAGNDGILNTSDDVRPFNNFLQQQTTLNTNGTPLWTLPDVIIDSSTSQLSLSGDSLTVTVNVVNQGAAAIGPPVYVSLYRKTTPQIFDINNFLAKDSSNLSLQSNDTISVSVVLTNFSSYLPLDSIAIRLNDNPSIFPVFQECDTLNNPIEIQLIEPYPALPAKQRLCLNGTTVPTLSYVADNISGVLYQWQESTDNINWTDILSATNSSYAPPITIRQTAGNYYYRRIRTYLGLDIPTIVTDEAFKITVAPCFLPVNPHLRGKMR